MLRNMTHLKAVLKEKEDRNARPTTLVQMNWIVYLRNNFKMQYYQNVHLETESTLLKRIFRVTSQLNKNISDQSFVVQPNRSVPNSNPQVVVPSFGTLVCSVMWWCGFIACIWRKKVHIFASEESSRDNETPGDKLKRKLWVQNPSRDWSRKRKKLWFKLQLALNDSNYYLHVT